MDQVFSSRPVYLVGEGVGPVFDSSEGTFGSIDLEDVVLNDTGSLLIDLFNTTTDDDGGDSALTELTIKNILFAGDDAAEFSFADFTPGLTLSKGESLGISIELDPLELGVKQAVMSI